MGNKVVGIIVTVAFFVLVALVGYRLYQEQSESQEASAPPAVEQEGQATAPEPEDKAGEESAVDTEAAQEESASAEDEAAGSSSAAGGSGTEAGDEQASGGEPGDEPLAEDDSADIPSFDVVRVEQTGEGVIAGRAEPSWDVALQSNEETIAETKADPAGQWSLVLDEPLGPGEHSLSILATSPDGEKSLTSQQKVLVSMGDEPGGKTVVALREPGKATQILQEHAAGEANGGEAGDDSKSQERMAAADTGDDAASSSGDGTSERDKSAAAHGDASASETSGDDGEGASADDTVEAKQAGEERQARPEPTIRIKTVDYEDRGEQSGEIIVTGISTKPTTDILLYLDGELIGEGQTDTKGDWKIEATHYLAPGNRALQVDLVDRSNDTILGRAAVGMRRQTPPPTAEQVAEADSDDAEQAGEAGGGTSSETASGSSPSDPEPAGDTRVAQSERVAGDRATSGASDMSAPPSSEDETPSASSDAASPAASAEAPSDASGETEQSTADAGDMPDPDRAPGEEIPDPDRSPGDMASAEAQSQPEAMDETQGPKVYTVRRGDTLWAIAEEHFGGGWRYTMIFKDNRGKIRNPHWIYPDQQFQIRPEQ